MIICLGTTPTVQRTMAFDRLRIDAVNRARDVHQFASGKSINAARVVHALAEPVLAMGLLGGDGGRFIRRDLGAAGVAHDFVEVAPPTRMCLTLLDESAMTATELVEESQPVGHEAYNILLEKLAAALPRAKALVLSGTLPPDAPAPFYADCVALAGPDVPVILDARGQPLLEALARRPFLVKPNRRELAETLDADVDDDESLHGAMRELTARGARWIVVTSGTRPIWITDGRSFWSIRPPQVDAINPIGSGDALAGGVAVGLVRGQDLPQAAAFGVACAAANVTTAHAGHVRPDDVRELLPRVRIEAI